MKAIAVLTLPLLAACATLRPHTADMPDARGDALYRDAIVIDMHNDMPSRVLEDGYDPDVRHEPGFGPSGGDTDYPRLLESGITAQFFSAWVDASFARTTPDSSFERAMQMVDVITGFAARHPERLFVATTAADVERAKREGKVAVFIGVEGGHAIESSLDNLRTLYARGARYLTLTWNNGNDWAGSSIGVFGTRRGGLTPFGRDVVHEMNRLGMLVDVSHVSDSTFWDVLSVSTDPVIASHSSARALADHARNLSDDQLRAVARNGGVVNVNFYSSFLDSTFFDAKDSVERSVAAQLEQDLQRPGADAATLRAAARARTDSLVQALPRPTVDAIVTHIAHVVEVAGIDHVGLGSDFDGVGGLLPTGMEDVTRLHVIAGALLSRGYSDADVRKVLGGNMMRVMRQVLDRQR